MCKQMFNYQRRRRPLNIPSLLEAGRTLLLTFSPTAVDRRLADVNNWSRVSWNRIGGEVALDRARVLIGSAIKTVGTCPRESECAHVCRQNETQPRACNSREGARKQTREGEGGG